MAAAAFSGPEIIKQALEETVKEMGLSSLKSKQTEAIFCGWQIYFCIIPHRVWQVCTATLVTHGLLRRGPRT